MDAEAALYRAAEQRLIDEAHRLKRLVSEIKSERSVLRAPLIRVKAAGGDEVWTGGIADSFRSGLSAVEAKIEGPSLSVDQMLADTVDRVNAKIAQIYLDAQEANRAARRP